MIKKKLLKCGCVLRDDKKVNVDISWDPYSLLLNPKCYTSQRGGGDDKDLLKSELIQNGDIVGYSRDGEIKYVEVIKIHYDDGSDKPYYTIKFKESGNEIQTVIDKLLLANIEIDMKPSKKGKDVHFIFKDGNEEKQFYDCECEELPDIKKQKENPNFFSKLIGNTTKKDDTNPINPLKCECNSKKFSEDFNEGFVENRDDCYDTNY